MTRARTKRQRKANAALEAVITAALQRKRPADQLDVLAPAAAVMIKRSTFHTTHEARAIDVKFAILDHLRKGGRR